MRSDLGQLAKIAQRSVRTASEMVEQADSNSLVLRRKGKQDFTTSLDLEIEAMFKGYLAEKTPEIPFWGEETGKTVPDSTTHWILDPIDGTLNFIHQLPCFAVSLALVEEQQATVGVVGLPATGEHYTAIRGEGAFLNGERISVSPTETLTDAVVGYGDPNLCANAVEINRGYHDLLQELQNTTMRTRLIGAAAVQLAWLAAGRIDISFTWGNLPWDVQAGLLLVHEAGGTAMDIDGSVHSLESRCTVATNRNLQSTVRNRFVHQDKPVSQQAEGS